MPELPTGTITFLFTDVEGSTKLWEQHPEPMRGALIEHDALIEFLTEQHGGMVVRPRGEGDSRFCVFARATDAVAAAAAIQQALHETSWPPETPLRVRLALHTGEADLRDGDYYGSAVNRCARLRAVAHGGQTVLSQATYDLVRDALPESVTLSDLGEHRLRDLARPERIYHLLQPQVPDQFPPLRSLDTLPNNLPLQLTRFVWREQEMAQVRALLQETRDSPRLLTLTGPGGTGKTRLALQVAAEVLEAFPDGVWLVELADIGDPNLIPQAIATALGVHEETGYRIEQTLTSYLRPRYLLLVLDNCEHLVEACANVATALLRACPHLRLLATSREALGVPGETAWRVPSLGVPDQQHMPAPQVISQYEAVQLFVDRAVAAVPSFQVTDQNASAVAQICHRLDGIPLAIELAAARLKVLPPQQLLARLEDRFRLLTGGARTAVPRQQTLQALVDWSYDLLTEPERQLLRRLSVFSGGWGLEAAEAICSDDEGQKTLRYAQGQDPHEGEDLQANPHSSSIRRDDVLDLLAHLVDKSLVVTEESDEGTARYRFLETLRQYGRQRLISAGEADSLRHRHATYFLDLAEEASTHFHRH